MTNPDKKGNRFTSTVMAIKSARLVCAALICSWSLASTAQTINVEIDYMVEQGAGAHSHQPTQAEIDAVVQMFACHGITLNVVIDDPLAHTDVLTRVDGSIFNNSDQGQWGDFKTNWFNNGSGWHYCVFGHQYESLDDMGNIALNSSGVAEFLGDDCLISLGSFAQEIGTPWDRTATFAHELGHNLGLTHAAGQDSGVVGDNKPNLASIMSYEYQLAGVRRQMLCRGLADETSLFKELDYSNGRLRTLDEASLDETVGVGIRPTDWDCDGSVDTDPVSAELGEGVGMCGAPGTQSEVWDGNEWGALFIGPAAARSQAEPRVIECIRSDEAQEVEQRLRSSAGALPDPSQCPAGRPTVTSEVCENGEMIFVDSSFFGIPLGTGDNPQISLPFAESVAPEDSVLYLQPGTYNVGGPMTFSKPLTLSGPGEARIEP